MRVHNAHGGGGGDAADGREQGSFGIARGEDSRSDTRQRIQQRAATGRGVGGVSTMEQEYMHKCYNNTLKEWCYRVLRLEVTCQLRGLQIQKRMKRRIL